MNEKETSNNTIPSCFGLINNTTVNLGRVKGGGGPVKLMQHGSVKGGVVKEVP